MYNDAIEFGDWLKTFEPLTKENNQWVLDCQISTEELYEAFLRDKADVIDDVCSEINNSFKNEDIKNYVERAISAGLSIGYDKNFNIDKRQEVIEQIINSLPPIPTSTEQGCGTKHTKEYNHCCPICKGTAKKML